MQGADTSQDAKTPGEGVNSAIPITGGVGGGGGGICPVI